MFEETYPSLADVPEAVKHLYRELDDGSAAILGAADFKSMDDFTRVQTALTKERGAHKATKTKYSAFAEMDLEEALGKLDRFDELEAAAAGGSNEEAVQRIVESRLTAKTAPLQRQLKLLETSLAEKEQQVSDYAARDKKRTIHDAIRSAATSAKVLDTAVADALVIGEHMFDIDESGAVLTRDGVGVTPGVGVDVWLSESRTTRPHWWPESRGAGSRGGAGSFTSNPFHKDSLNMTEQARLFREDPAKAQQMAKAAGVSIGA